MLEAKMTNLLEETVWYLQRHGKTPSDVRWVGTQDGRYAISWEEFEKIARDTNYDGGYGVQKIAYDLVVVGDDWWLERGEYDGAEWWEFKTLPKKAQNPLPFGRVTSRKAAWDRLEEILSRSS